MRRECDLGGSRPRSREQVFADARRLVELRDPVTLFGSSLQYISQNPVIRYGNPDTLDLESPL